MTLERRIAILEAALKKILHHCEVAATHSAIHAVAERALRESLSEAGP
jgi:hypothetical protein